MVDLSFLTLHSHPFSSPSFKCLNIRYCLYRWPERLVIKRRTNTITTFAITFYKRRGKRCFLYAYLKSILFLSVSIFSLLLSLDTHCNRKISTGQGVIRYTHNDRNEWKKESQETVHSLNGWESQASAWELTSSQKLASFFLFWWWRI